MGRSVGFPRFPVALPFGPIQRCISNLFPRSVSKIFKTIQSWIVTKRQVCPSGRGNSEENAEVKSSSELVHRLNNCLAFVGRDAMSAIVLSSPGTWSVRSGPAWWQYNKIASPLISRPEIGVFAFDAILVIQLTVGVLSHKVPSA